MGATNFFANSSQGLPGCARLCKILRMQPCQAPFCQFDSFIDTQISIMLSSAERGRSYLSNFENSPPANQFYRQCKQNLCIILGYMD